MISNRIGLLIKHKTNHNIIILYTYIQLVGFKFKNGNLNLFLFIFLLKSEPYLLKKINKLKKEKFAEN